MEPILDQVRQEPTGIHEELPSLSPNAFERRMELEDRRNELGQLSHTHVEGQPLHQAEALRAAFKRNAELREHLIEQPLSKGETTSVGDGGIDSDFTPTVNRAIESGLGIDEVEVRLTGIIGQMRSSS